jgi:hypothetical protein
MLVKRGEKNREFFGRSIGGRDGRALLLAVAGLKLALDPQTRARGILMIVAALVLVMNVMIWTV